MQPLNERESLRKWRLSTLEVADMLMIILFSQWEALSP